MTPDDVRRLAGSVPQRWTELDFVHRSDHRDYRAVARHGELDAVDLSDGSHVRERGAPPSSWSVRPLEPYATNYEWSAMLDPYELTTGVVLREVRATEIFGRPAVAFIAVAVAGYDPICSCCPLVFPEVSQRLEHGSGWTGQPGDVPEATELALDLEIGMVVSSRDVGGQRAGWFTNEITRCVSQA